MKNTNFDPAVSLFASDEVFPSLDWTQPIFSPAEQQKLGDHITIKDLSRLFQQHFPLLKNVWQIYVNALPARSFSWVNVEQWKFPSISELVYGISVLTGYLLSDIYLAGYAEMISMRAIQKTFDGTLVAQEVVNLVLSRSYKALSKSVIL